MFSFANSLSLRGWNKLGCYDEAQMLLVLVGVGFGRIQTYDNSNVLAIITIQTHHRNGTTHFFLLPG